MDSGSFAERISHLRASSGSLCINASPRAFWALMSSYSAFFLN